MRKATGHPDVTQTEHENNCLAPVALIIRLRPRSLRPEAERLRGIKEPKGTIKKMHRKSFSFITRPGFQSDSQHRLTV